MTMHFIHTNHLEEQRQLQRQFSSKNGYYLIPQKCSYFLVEMMTSISFEYFQNRVPVVVDKIKEMLVNTMNGTYNLAAYRQVMGIVKKQYDTMQVYRQHLIQMNRAFAEDELGLENLGQEEASEDQDILFEEALKGQGNKYSNLQQLFQLPVLSSLEIPSSDTPTENTVKSDMHWSQIAIKDSLKIDGMGTNKLQNFFASNEQYSLQSWKTGRKQQNTQQTSRQMNSFTKKRSTIIDINKDLDEIVANEVKYDLNRQISLASAIVGEYQDIKMKQYQKRIKNTILNYKLRPRRK